MKQSKSIQLLKKHFYNKKQSLPILRHAVINNDNIKCNDTKNECILYIDEKISTLDAVVDLSVLAAFADIKTITHITDDKIVNEFNDVKTDIKIDRLDVSDYPIFDKKANDRHTIDIVCNDLLESINRIDYAMAEGDVRYYLNGMCFDFLDDKIKLIATDGHRLALTECKLMGESANYRGQHIVNRSTILLLKSVLKLTQCTELSISILDNSIIEFRANDFLITAKLVDGTYPDYNRVIPKNNTELLRLDRKETLKTIKQLKPFLNKKYPVLVIDIEAREFEAYHPASSMRLPMPVLDCSETINAIAFNANYIIDFLNNNNEDIIDFYLIDKNSSMVSTANNSTHVIMPVV